MGVARRNQKQPTRVPFSFACPPLAWMGKKPDLKHGCSLPVQTRTVQHNLSGYLGLKKLQAKWIDTGSKALYQSSL